MDRLLVRARPGACQQFAHALYRTAVMTGLHQGELIAAGATSTSTPDRVHRSYSVASSNAA